MGRGSTMPAPRGKTTISDTRWLNPRLACLLQKYLCIHSLMTMEKNDNLSIPQHKWKVLSFQKAVGLVESSSSHTHHTSFVLPISWNAQKSVSQKGQSYSFSQFLRPKRQSNHMD